METLPFSIRAARQALGTPERPVSTTEFLEFWNSLSEKEKEEFRAEAVADE